MTEGDLDLSGTIIMTTMAAKGAEINCCRNYRCNTDRQPKKKKSVPPLLRFITTEETARESERGEIIGVEIEMRASNARILLLY